MHSWPSQSWFQICLRSSVPDICLRRENLLCFVEKLRYTSKPYSQTQMSCKFAYLAGTSYHYLILNTAVVDKDYNFIYGCGRGVSTLKHPIQVVAFTAHTARARVERMNFASNLSMYQHNFHLNSKSFSTHYFVPWLETFRIKYVFRQLTLSRSIIFM